MQQVGIQHIAAQLGRQLVCCHHRHFVFPLTLLNTSFIPAHCAAECRQGCIQQKLHPWQWPLQCSCRRHRVIFAVDCTDLLGAVSCGASQN